MEQSTYFDRYLSNSDNQLSDLARFSRVNLFEKYKLLDGANDSLKRGDTFPGCGKSTTTNNEAFDTLPRLGQLISERRRTRLVNKDGTCNIVKKRGFEHKRYYFIDIFTTLVDMKWKYNFLLFFLSFILTWVVFALAWWTISVTHSDHLHVNELNWTSCVENVYDFSSAFLFSVETQHTIGYGFRVAQPQCPHGVLLLMLQSATGVLIQSLITGIIFAKLSRPKGRSRTLMFSQNAVICQRDGEHCLIFRVAYTRRSTMINAKVRAVLLQNKLTKEGETIKLCQNTLELTTNTNMEEFLLLAWPTYLVHKIDKKSPLWDVSAQQLWQANFEIVVTLEGVIESTGKSVQIRTSYLPTEILWGFRFVPLITRKSTKCRYTVDYCKFDKLMEVEMSESSAKSYSENHEVGMNHITQYNSIEKL